MCVSTKLKKKEYKFVSMCIYKYRLQRSLSDLQLSFINIMFVSGFLMMIFSLCAARPTHFTRDGDENQNLVDSDEYESASSLPTINFYYKFPPQKNDLGRKLRGLQCKD